MMGLTHDYSPSQLCLTLYAVEGAHAKNETQGVEYVQPLL